MKFLILSLLVVSSLCVAQVIPDAPSSFSNSIMLDDGGGSGPQIYQPPTCGRFHWSCWNYPSIPTKQVFASKSFWLTFGGDVALTSMNNEIIHEKQANGQCSIYHRQGLESRGRLYLGSLPENAAVGIVSFIWLKVKGPKAILPAFLAYPAYLHIHSAIHWEEDCFN